MFDWTTIAISPLNSIRTFRSSRWSGEASSSMPKNEHVLCPTLGLLFVICNHRADPVHAALLWLSVNLLVPPRRKEYVSCPQ